MEIVNNTNFYSTECTPVQEDSTMAGKEWKNEASLNSKGEKELQSFSDSNNVTMHK